MTEAEQLKSIGRIRTCQAWLRRTSKPISEYPRRTEMSEREMTEARQFASGILPRPDRWTIRLYSLATGQ